MKALFNEIRAGSVDAIAARLAKNAQLVHAVSTAPPKKDDGQSTLQVALKSGQFDVARLLLKHGADVTFTDQSKLNAWNTPVLHDAIRATVFSTRWGRNRALPGAEPRIEMMSSQERFESALDVLERILAAGAETSAVDSYGNPALSRAVLDARQVLDEPVLLDLEADLRQVFDALFGAGAKSDWVDQRTGETLADSFAHEPVGRFLAP